MTQPASVQVIIPTYNQADLLREALHSVIAQDYPNWTAVVINNMSSDHTKKVMAEFHDSRISELDFANHGIIAASRNIGISRSNSTYIAFLDSDDWWFPNKLSQCVNLLNSGADLVCHAEEWRSSTGTRTVAYGPETRASYMELLLRGNCLSTSAVVGRTDMFQHVGGFSTNPNFVTAEDYELWLRLAELRYTFAFIPKPLGVFRLHEASASSAVERNSHAEMAVVEHHLVRAGITSRNVVRRRLALSHYAAGRAHHKGGDLIQARSRFANSIRLSPFTPRTYAGILVLAASFLVGGRRNRLYER